MRFGSINLFNPATFYWSGNEKKTSFMVWLWERKMEPVNMNFLYHTMFLWNDWIFLNVKKVAFPLLSWQNDSYNKMPISRMFSYSDIGIHSQVFRPFDLSCSQRPLNCSAFQDDVKVIPDTPRMTNRMIRYTSYEQSNDLYAL